MLQHASSVGLKKKIGFKCITPFLRKLHFLFVQFRIQFKCKFCVFEE